MRERSTWTEPLDYRVVRACVGECEALLAVWHFDAAFPQRAALASDAAALGCMTLSRATFSCLLDAKDDRQADACN